MKEFFPAGRGRRITCVVLALLVLSAFLSGALGALGWPAENAVLIRNFGFNHRGRPNLGMVFAGDSKVLAAEKGEVIFSRSGNDTASRLPSPLGAWTAVDHGDGLISIYSRYADEAVSFTRVEKQQPIAAAGTSGWSSQNGFYFMIYDRRERRWINPEMIITPLRETRPPQIVSVNFQNVQGMSVQQRNFSQGRYTIIVNAGAAAPGVRNLLAPHRIICLVNGAEVGSLGFEAVSARDGVLMVYRNGLVPAKQIYANYPAFEAAEVFLNRGQINIEIIVQDIAGNSRNTISRMIVN